MLSHPSDERLLEIIIVPKDFLVGLREGSDVVDQRGFC